jgi:hypothetical protein
MASGDEIEMPPFQNDTTLDRVYGAPSAITSIIVYNKYGGIEETIPYTPRNWYSLRQMQRHQIRDFGTQYQPYSRGVPK